MRIAVTGRSGRIGRYVAQELDNAGGTKLSGWMCSTIRKPKAVSNWWILPKPANYTAR